MDGPKEIYFKFKHCCKCLLKIGEYKVFGDSVDMKNMGGKKQNRKGGNKGRRPELLF